MLDALLGHLRHTLTSTRPLSAHCWLENRCVDTRHVVNSMQRVKRPRVNETAMITNHSVVVMAKHSVVVPCSVSFVAHVLRQLRTTECSLVVSRCVDTAISTVDSRRDVPTATIADLAVLVVVKRGLVLHENLAGVRHLTHMLSDEKPPTDGHMTNEHAQCTLRAHALHQHMTTKCSLVVSRSGAIARGM